MIAVVVGAALVAACVGGAKPPAGTGAARALSSGAPTQGSEQPTPLASGVKLDTVAAADDITVSLTSSVARGQIATLNVKTVPRAECTVTLADPAAGSSGPTLSAKGADGAGEVSWSWTVASDARLGAWSAEVSCSTPSGLRAVARQVFTVRP